MRHRFETIRRVFLDMDGTIYEGSRLYDCTIPFLAFLTSRGIGYSFLTNNSSYSTPEYVERLHKMGVECAAENFYTSTDYTIDFLKQFHPEIRSIYWLGMPKVAEHFRQAKLAVASEESMPDAVVIGFDRELTYPRLCRAAWLLKQQLPGFATHPDPACPTDLPTCLVDCGALTACLERATGKKLKVLGKPDPGMLKMAAARFGLTPEQTLMVGDRLSTDIAVGRNAGAFTCHITAGNWGESAPESLRPHCEAHDLAELQELWRAAIQ